MAAEWFYLSDGRETGPIEFEALRELLGAGSLSPDDLVRGPSVANWTPATDIPILEISSTGTSTMQPTAISHVPDATLAIMRRTKPWVRFVAVVTLLGAALFAAAGVMTLLSHTSLSVTDPFQSFFATIYFALAAMELSLAGLLFRYGNKIQTLSKTRGSSDLDQALAAQKAYWTFLGTAISIAIVVYAVCLAYSMTIKV